MGSIFIRKIIFRVGGHWGAYARPLAPGIDSGWSPGMLGTIFSVPSGLSTDRWPIRDPLQRHWIIEVPESRQLYACIYNVKRIVDLSSGCQAPQRSNVYGWGLMCPTGRSVGRYGYQTSSLTRPGTILHQFPGPGRVQRRPSPRQREKLFFL